MWHYWHYLVALLAPTLLRGGEPCDLLPSSSLKQTTGLRYILLYTIASDNINRILCGPRCAATARMFLSTHLHVPTTPRVCPTIACIFLSSANHEASAAVVFLNLGEACV